MGKLHTSHALSECIAKISKRGFPAKFLFHSKGPELEKMHVDMQEKGLLHDGQVVIGSPLPSQEWVKTMTDSHIAIVTMKSGAENVVMPSKTYSALCAGQAVLAIAPKGSDLAKTVIENECGWVVEPDDVDGLEKTVFEILNDRDQVQQKRVNAFTAGHGRYTMDKVAAEWVDILEKIDEE
jgi:glycosyltransferase involved in cell wall biosynthesis